jgi:acyl dehydratase
MMTLDDVRVGGSLPELAIPVTTSLIVLGAISTYDYEEMHHDIEAAQAGGLPNLFMNILTSTGLVQRFVTDWAGENARIRKCALRLGAPNLPGDVMKLNGEVSSIDSAEGTAEIKVVGTNSIGQHVLATVVLGFAETVH